MAESLRICHIVSSFRPLIGGVERATETLSAELEARGVDVSVVTRRIPEVPSSVEASGFPVFRAGMPGRGKLSAASFGVHALWLLVTRLRRTQVVHVQNIDTPLLIAVLLKSLFRRTVIATIHGEQKIAQKQRSLAGRARLALMRRSVDHFIALTRAMEEALIDLGVAADRITRISNPIDVGVYRPPTDAERRRAREALDLPNADPVCLFVGRLVPGKRVDLLIEAWEVVNGGSERRHTLVVVGDGPERKRLEQRAARSSPQHIRFAGSTDNVLRYLHAADLFVLPSDGEGLPMALIEAMAVGISPMVTDLPGYKGLIEDGVSGFLVPKGDARALAERIDEVLRSDEDRARIGRTARDRVARTSSVRAVGEQHLELYRGLASLKAPARSEPAEVDVRQNQDPEPRRPPTW